MFPTADAAGQQVSLITRVKVWFSEQPLLTKTILVLCVSIYAVQVVGGYDNFGLVCLSAQSVTKLLQVYRVLTSPFIHGGLLHIAFNMLAFVPIGCSLERTLGTLALAHLIGLLILLGAGIYIGFATAAAAAALRYTVQLAYQCAIGFSGVIFGLIVVDNNISGATQRSIFGFFYVPAPLYPWVLMLLWQVIMPGVSFLGHLCGVLVGQLYVWGLLQWITPSSSTLQRRESASSLAWLYTQPMFIANTGGATGGLPVHAPPAASDQSTGHSLMMMFERMKLWLQHRSEWTRVPSDEAPTRPLSDPLVASSHDPPPSGDDPSPRTAAAAAAQARQAKFEAAQHRGSSSS